MTICNRLVTLHCYEINYCELRDRPMGLDGNLGEDFVSGLRKRS